MSRFLTLALALVLPLAFASCFEKSTVIKVARDGSGIVHVREYSATKDKEEDVELPDESELEARAARMGAGVRLQSVKKSINSKGWHGTEVIYEFNDINGLVLHGSDPKDEEDQDAEREGGGKEDMHFQFTMKQGVLEVVAVDDRWRDSAGAAGAAGNDDSPTIDPYAGTSGPRASGIKVTSTAFDMNGEAWKSMSRGMRIGIFIQIDEPLAETNSRYANGSLFTLLNADMEAITKSGELGSIEELDGRSRGEMRELVDRVDGFEMELQEPVRFVFE